jgi:hypothetical protein
MPSDGESATMLQFRGCAFGSHPTEYRRTRHRLTLLF